MHGAMKKITLAGVALAFLVVVLGAYTRLVDAGLGCPDWPGCYGHLAVPQTATEIQFAEVRFPETPVRSGQGVDGNGAPLRGRGAWRADPGDCGAGFPRAAAGTAEAACCARAPGDAAGRPSAPGR